MITVHYGCDYEGDYTAPITKCITSRIREFSDIDDALTFVEKCSYIYNLDEILGVIPYEQVPDVLDKVKEIV